MASRASKRKLSASFLGRCTMALLLSAGSMARAVDLTAEIHRCEDCHGPGGHADVLPVDGRIAGQNEDYLVWAPIRPIRRCKPGCGRTSRNAATVNRDRSWPRQRCSHIVHSLPMKMLIWR